ncbi:hypothetical protein Lal_00041487 [Lupinus albus]|nr:hypothetical protein Lal_00041487 [Lupinus albus]
MRSNLIFINQIEVQLPSRVRKPNLCKNPNFSLRQPLYAVRRRYRRSPSRNWAIVSLALSWIV